MDAAGGDSCCGVFGGVLCGGFSADRRDDDDRGRRAAGLAERDGAGG